MRLDMRHRADKDYFVDMARMAGQEIQWILDRLGKSRAVKAAMGLYAGGNVAAGFVIDFQEKSETFERYIPYAPHIAVVNELFLIGLRCNGSIVAVIRECKKNDIYFPLFDHSVSPKMETRTGLRFCHPKLDANGVTIGYEVGRGLLYSIFRNPIYIGFLVRGGEVLENKIPVTVDPDIFSALYELMDGKEHKPRRSTSGTSQNLLQGIIFVECKHGTTRPAYFSSAKRVRAESHPDAHGSYKCSCGETYPDLGSCFHVSAYVIMNPVEEFVVSQLSVPHYMNSVRDNLEVDYRQSKSKIEGIKHEKKKLMDELSKLRHNFSQTYLDSTLLTMMQEEILDRQEKLKALEQQESMIGSETTVSNENLNYLTSFLSDLKTEWAKLSTVLRNRFIRLVLQKVVIRQIPDGNIFVDIIWRTNVTQTIWIERPPISALCKVWSNEDQEKLRKFYPTAAIEEILEQFPDRNWDAIRSIAKRYKITRTVRMGSEWTEDDKAVLYKLAGGELTYKEARNVLRQHRQTDIFRWMKRLGLQQPDINKLNWRIVGNSASNELSSRE